MKKNANPNHKGLEANRPLFFLLGLSLSLLTAYTAFEMNFGKQAIADFSSKGAEMEEINWTHDIFGENGLHQKSQMGPQWAQM